MSQTRTPFTLDDDSPALFTVRSGGSSRRRVFDIVDRVKSGLPSAVQHGGDANLWRFVVSGRPRVRGRRICRAPARVGHVFCVESTLLRCGRGAVRAPLFAVRLRRYGSVGPVG